MLRWLMQVPFSFSRVALSCNSRGFLAATQPCSAVTSTKVATSSSIHRQQGSTYRSLTYSTSPQSDLNPHTSTNTSSSDASVARNSSILSPATRSEFVPRQSFALPTTTPSWYAGHMARAIRSMPYLLARYPPPLVIEARDARLPLTSINPVFEKLLKKAPTANDGLDEPSSDSSSRIKGGADASTWRSRRLIVYLKKDLIDPVVEANVLEAMRERHPLQHVLFLDTRNDSDVKKVLYWVQKQARKIALDGSINAPPKQLSERAEKRAKKGLSGAFRHTPTPEEGVRLLILGMPNVGKSSLLNALRRVGTGKGKAASTAPHPGHTRKLTGTVRISKAGPTKVEADVFMPGRRSSRKSTRLDQDDREAAFGGETFMISTENENKDLAEKAEPTIQIEGEKKDTKPKDPPIYVYDTPGVMVPFLGHGASGAERGIKLAITAGIKDSLFDVQLLADYLLFRLNLRATSNPSASPSSSSSSSSSSSFTTSSIQTTSEKERVHDTLPSYIKNLPLSLEEYLSTCEDVHGRTNEINELLWHVAGKAPGSLRKGKVRDLDAAATFMLQHWRLGKLDGNTELDLNTMNGDEIRRKIQGFFEIGEDVGNVCTDGKVSVGLGVVHGKKLGLGRVSEGESRTQAKKMQKKQDVVMRKRKWMDKGISVGKSSNKASWAKRGKKKRK